MLWFSVEKGEIHVGWSGTSCDFETLEFYCDFFSFPPAFLEQLSEMGHGGCVIVCLTYLKKKWDLSVK